MTFISSLPASTYQINTRNLPLPQANANQANASMIGGAYGPETVALSIAAGGLAGAAAAPAAVFLPQMAQAKIAAARIGATVKMSVPATSIGFYAGVGAVSGVAGAVASSLAADDPIKGAVIGGATGGVTAIGTGLIMSQVLGATIEGSLLFGLGIPGIVAGAVAGAIAQTL